MNARAKGLVLFCALLAAACGAAQAGLLVPDCKEDRAALDRFLASLPASCEKNSDCDCYYYNVFPEDGPVALRAPGVSQEQWRRLDDAQQLVRRACGPELAAGIGRGTAYSYSARCESGRCVRVKTGAKGPGSVLNGMSKPSGKVVRPGELFSSLARGLLGLAKKFFSLLLLGFYAFAKYVLPVFLLCAGGYAVFVVFLRRRSGKEAPAAVPAAEKAAPAEEKAAPAEAQAAPAPPEEPVSVVRRIMNALGYLCLLFFVFLAVMMYSCYREFGPRTFSEGELRDFCVPALEQAGFTLRPGDKIVKGGKTDSWMDSSNFCLLKTDPARTLAITRCRGQQPPPSPDIDYEDPLTCKYYDAKRHYPGWWRGGDQPGAACYDTSTNPNHPRGVRVVIFDSEGLVFVEQWHS